MKQRQTFDPTTDKVDTNKLAGSGSRWHRSRVEAQGAREDHAELLAAILDEQRRTNELLERLVER